MAAEWLLNGVAGSSHWQQLCDVSFASPTVSAIPDASSFPPQVLLEWNHAANGEAPAPMLKDKFGAERRKAKTLNFSIAYGKTKSGLAKDWDVSVEEAEETIIAWFSPFSPFPTNSQPPSMPPFPLLSLPLYPNSDLSLFAMGCLCAWRVKPCAYAARICTCGDSYAMPRVTRATAGTMRGRKSKIGRITSKRRRGHLGMCNVNVSGAGGYGNGGASEGGRGGASEGGRGGVSEGGRGGE